MNADRRRDLFSAMLFLILGLLTVFVLIPQGVVVPGSVKVAALSPDFWPRMIGFGAIAASAFLLVETLTMQQPHIDDDEAEEAAEYQLDLLPATLRVLVLIAGLFAFYFSLTTLGVVAASALLIFAKMLFFGERKFWLVGVLSIGVPVLLYLFFRYVASVPIPLGIFGN